MVSFNKHLPWLLDSLEALNEEQKRWAGHHDQDPTSLLDLAVSLSQTSLGADRIVLHKLDAIIVLLSAGVVERLSELYDEGQTGKAITRTLALALVHLADAAVRNRPISRLVAAQLLKSLDGLVTEAHVESDRDLRVVFDHPPSCI